MHHIAANFTCEDDEYEIELWDFQEAVAAHFLPAVHELAPSTNHTGKLTLADLQKRRYYTAELGYNHEEPRLSAISPMECEDTDFFDEWWDSKSISSKSPFPILQPEEVEVICKDPLTVFDVTPEKVIVHGHTYFYKTSWSSHESNQAVEKYAKIKECNIPENQLRTSRLYAAVVDSKGKTRGQLYHWIDMDSVLTWEVIEKATSEKREKWAAQIKTTVSLLHQIGVVWGDVKAENVVIDRNGNAVIIDFEGGATKGWIDKEVMDTKEGDLQGLERLVSFILDDESPLSAREKNIEIDYRCEDGEMECVGS